MVIAVLQRSNREIGIFRESAAITPEWACIIHPHMNNVRFVRLKVYGRGPKSFQGSRDVIRMHISASPKSEMGNVWHAYLNANRHAIVEEICNLKWWLFNFLLSRKHMRMYNIICICILYQREDLSQTSKLRQNKHKSGK